MIVGSFSGHPLAHAGGVSVEHLEVWPRDLTEQLGSHAITAQFFGQLLKVVAHRIARHERIGDHGESHPAPGEQRHQSLADQSGDLLGRLVIHINHQDVEAAPDEPFGRFPVEPNFGPAAVRRKLEAV